MRNPGLIGGLGPLATIHYYREPVKHEPGETLVIHADMAHALAHVQRGDRDGLADYFARLIGRCARRGEILARGYRRVALFGTRFVVESKMFGIVPAQMETIHDMYMQTVAGGTGGRAVLRKSRRSCRWMRSCSQGRISR